MTTAALVLGLALAAPAEERPGWLAEAIAAGATRETLPPYLVPGTSVEYTTPFRRVARAANKEFRAGRTLRPENVDPRAWAPELRVLIGARSMLRPGAPAVRAVPRSARLLVGAGEIASNRMETDTKASLLKAVFPITGTAPYNAELEVTYTWTEGGREERFVERVPLEFRKQARW